MRQPVRPRARPPASGPYTGYGVGSPAGLAFASDTSSYTLATAFRVDQAGLSLTKGRLYLDSGSGAIVGDDLLVLGDLLFSLFAADTAGPGATGTALFTAVTKSAGVVVDAWNEFVLGTPFPLTSGTIYYASMYLPAGRYSARSGEFTAQVDASPILFPANGSAQGGSGTVANGAYRVDTFGPATQVAGAAWYGIDVEVSA